MITDLQALASTAANYFPDQQIHGNMPINYGHQGHNGNGAQGYYGPTPPQPAYTYGNVSYSNHGGDVANQATMESMKNGLDIIRSLFPEHQRGEFDPRSYQQVESRIAALQNYTLPFLSQPLMAQGQALAAGGGDDPFGSSQYALPPMDHLRTKSDLINLDQLFSTMQSTIYDNPTEVAAAGVGQPGIQYVPAGAGYRSSQSPPGAHLNSSHNVPVTTPPSQHSGTPGLTPPSSAVSNTSGNSPPSMQLSSMSPTTPGVMYPTLPGPSTSQSYVPSSMAPTSTLGNQFDHDQRRRYSGGRLQKAAPAFMKREHPENAMDTSSDGAATPKNAIVSSSSSETGSMNKKKQTKSRIADFSSLNLDPALGGTASPAAGEMSEESIKANEIWVGNIRTIEALRAWIRRRLENHEYEIDGDEMDQGLDKDDVKEEKGSLYPVLNGVDGD